MQWQRLDRDDSVKVINSVKSDENQGMFSAQTSEVKRARLPFYKDYSLYRVTNFASLPSFTFEFLSDGQFFHYLDGTESPIYTVNDKGALTLSEANVMAYLNLYFTQVGHDEGDDVFVVTNPHEMPMLDSLDTEAYDSVFNNHKPPQIKHNPALNSFEIETDLYIESHMVRAKIEVGVKGRVSIKEQSSSMQQVMKAPDSGQLM